MTTIAIPVRGDTWRVYVALFAETGAWPERFVRLYLQGDLTRIPPEMQREAEQRRAEYLSARRRIE